MRDENDESLIAGNAVVESGSKPRS